MYVNVSVCMALATAYCAAFIGALTSLTASSIHAFYVFAALSAHKHTTKLPTYILVLCDFSIFLFLI